jgi:hypothetical protein
VICVVGYADVEEGHAESVASADVSIVSVGMVIGIIVLVLLVILVIIDVSCYFINDCGVIMNICTRVRGQDTAAKKEKDLEHGEGYVLNVLPTVLLQYMLQHMIWLFWSATSCTLRTMKIVMNVV